MSIGEGCLSDGVIYVVFTNIINMPDNNIVFQPRDNTRVSTIDRIGYVPATSSSHNIQRDFRWDDGPLGYMPVVGDVLQGAQAYEDFTNGRYGQAAIGAGLLLVPNAIEKVGKSMGPAFVRYITKRLARHPELKPKYYDRANKIMDFGQKHFSKINDYLSSPATDAKNALVGVDIEGARRNALNYQKLRDLETAPLVKGIEAELPLYDEAASIQVRPATVRENLMNNLRLTKSNSGFVNAVAFNDGTSIVAFPGVDGPIIGHELRHSIQHGFNGEKALDPTSGKFVPISRQPLKDNPALNGVKEILLKYNPEASWFQKLSELDAEVEKARQMFHPNTSWKELWDRQDSRLDSSLKFIRDRFHLDNNDEANYIMKTLYENGYCSGGPILRQYPDGGRIPTFSPLADFRASQRNVQPVFGGFGGGDFGGAGYGTSFDVSLDPALATQYVRNTPIPVERSFSDAYSAARNAGLKFFDFNGQRYTTDYDPNAKLGPRQMETYPALNIREVLDENKSPIKDSTRIEPYVGQIPGVHRRDFGGFVQRMNKAYGGDRQKIMAAISRAKEGLRK